MSDIEENKEVELSNEEKPLVDKVVNDVVEEVEEKSYATIDEVTQVVNSAIEKLESTFKSLMQEQNLNKPVQIIREVESKKEEPKKPLFL